MLLSVSANAQSPEIKFEKTVHDFGTIQENGGEVTISFEFTNTGDAPLIINAVQVSCGCTSRDWTREPISPKGKGFIKVSYNPKGRPGPFSKSVTVNSNSSKPVVLIIKGDVNKK